MEKYFSGEGQFRFRPDGGIWSTHVYIRPVRWINIDRYGRNRQAPEALLLSVFPGQSSSVEGQSTTPGLRAFVRSQLDADDQGLVAAHETGHLLGLKHPAGEHGSDGSTFDEVRSQFGSNLMSSGGGLPCQLGIGNLEGIDGNQFETILDGYEKGTLYGATRVDPDDWGNQFQKQFVDGMTYWYPAGSKDFYSDEHVLPYLRKIASDPRWSITGRTTSSSDSTPTVHVALGQGAGKDLFLGEMVRNASSPTIREETA